MCPCQRRSRTMHSSCLLASRSYLISSKLSTLVAWNFTPRQAEASLKASFAAYIQWYFNCRISPAEKLGHCNVWGQAHHGQGKGFLYLPLTASKELAPGSFAKSDYGDYEGDTLRSRTCKEWVSLVALELLTMTMRGIGGK